MIRISKQTSQRRKAAYKYYRDCGYSVKEAQRLRGQSTRLWIHYFQSGRRGGVKPPDLKSTRTELTEIRAELRAAGMRTRQAYNMTRRKEAGLQEGLYCIRRAREGYMKMLGINRRQAEASMRKATELADSIPEWLEDLGDDYDEEVGVV